MQCEDPFHSIDDLLDFQNYEDLLDMMGGCGNGSPLTSLQAPAIAGEIHGPPAAVTGGQINFEDDALRIMCEDNEIINPDWLSNVFEDSEINFSNPIEFRSQSPISVLETNIKPLPKARTQTKRPRSQITRPISASLTRWVAELEIKEKRRKDNLVDGDAVKKCLHCASQKTPQWRAGPMGPKTLCNACGVRYKSGRLFPEYRPAASPSFIPCVHSNSHKKVVEMRQQKANLSLWDGGMARKRCDLLSYINKNQANLT